MKLVAFFGIIMMSILLFDAIVIGMDFADGQDVASQTEEVATKAFIELGPVCVCQERNEALLILERLKSEVDQLCSKLECLADPSSCALCNQFNDLFASLEDQLNQIIKLLLAQGVTVCAKFLELELQLTEQENAICAQIAVIENLINTDLGQVSRAFAQVTTQTSIDRDLLLSKITTLGFILSTQIHEIVLGIETFITVNSNTISTDINGVKSTIINGVNTLINQVGVFQQTITTLTDAIFSDLELRVASDMCCWCAQLSDMGAKLTKNIAESTSGFEAQLTLLQDELTSKLSHLEYFFGNKDAQLISQISKVKEAGIINQLKFDNQLVPVTSALNSKILSSFNEIDVALLGAVDKLQLCLISLCTSLNSQLTAKTAIFECNLVKWLENFCLELSCLKSSICDILAGQFANTQLFALNKLDRLLAKTADMIETVGAQTTEVVASIDVLGAVVDQQICTKISNIETNQIQAANAYSNQFACFQANLLSQICSKLGALELTLLGKADELSGKITNIQAQLDSKITDNFATIDANLNASNYAICSQVQAAAAALESELAVELSDLGTELKKETHDLCVKVMKTTSILTTQIDTGIAEATSFKDSSGDVIASQIEDIITTLSGAYSQLCANIMTIEQELLQDINTIGADANSRLDDIQSIVITIYETFFFINVALLVEAAQGIGQVV